ncbi:MAG: MaoC family dehydratase [bacterium]|nr:MaoC family dehydratase [bacterium]
MSKIKITGYQDFEKLVGQELGVSDYLQIKQEQINLFGDATLDPQWIHTDPERAKKESPFGTTIAHGYLTLSIIPHLWEQIADVSNFKMMINYGIESLRFQQPVTVDSEVRLRVWLKSVKDLRGITKVEMDAKLEIKDEKKPAFSITIVFLYHFNQ